MCNRRQAATLATAWTAEDCRVTREGRKISEKTRMYAGSDGVMVPVITQAEKLKRRAKVKQKRRTCGKKRRPLPPLRKGTDQAWKEFKLIYFYDEESAPPACRGDAPEPYGCRTTAAS